MDVVITRWWRAVWWMVSVAAQSGRTLEGEQGMSGRVDDSDEGRSQAEPSEGSVEPGEGAWVERVIDRLGIGVFCVDNVQERVTRANEAYARLAVAGSRSEERFSRNAETDL